MGILDFLNSPDAQLGIGLLAAGGPTTDPNQVGLGQRLSAGMQNMRTSQAQQMDLAMKNAQMQNLAFSLKKNQLLYDTAAGLMGQGGQGADSSQPSPNGSIGPQGAAPQGMPQGGAPVSPGASAGAVPTAGALPANGASTVQGGRSPLFGNIPNNLAGFGLITDPNKLFEIAAGQYAPTDLQKSLNALGVQQGSPEWNAAIAANIRKGNYIAPTSMRPGGYGVGSDGKITQFPHVPDGSTAYQDASGQFHIVPVDGGLGAIGNAEAAKRRGVNTQTASTGVNSNGDPAFMTEAQKVDAANGVAPQGGIGDGRFPVATPGAPASGPLRPSLSAAGQAAAAESGKAAGQQLANDRLGANGYATRMFTLNKALTGLQNADTGPGGETVNNARSFLLAQNPLWVGKYLPGVDPGKIASYDEANKYLMQYAIGQAGALGEGTDGKLAATLSGNANTHISNLAAQDVVRANMGLERMRQAQVQQFSTTGLPPDKYPQWSTQWNKDINPQVFIWDSLPADKKKSAMEGMSANQRQAFTQQYNWALQNKFIDGAQ